MDQKILNFLNSYCSRLFDSYVLPEHQLINSIRVDLTQNLLFLKTVEYLAKGKNLPFEKLISYIPDNISSRSHRINSVNFLCEKKILLRVASEQDQRNVFIKPNKQVMEDYFKLVMTFNKSVY